MLDALKATLLVFVVAVVQASILAAYSPLHRIHFSTAQLSLRFRQKLNTEVCDNQKVKPVIERDYHFFAGRQAFP